MARPPSKLYTYRGKKQGLAQWAAELGLNEKTLDTRINRLGWDFKKAITTPARGRAANRTDELPDLKYKGKTWTVPKLAAEVGIHSATLYQRLYRGVPLKQALQPGRLT